MHSVLFKVHSPRSQCIWFDIEKTSKWNALKCTLYKWLTFEFNIDLALKKKPIHILHSPQIPNECRWEAFSCLPSLSISCIGRRSREETARLPPCKTMVVTWGRHFLKELQGGYEEQAWKEERKEVGGADSRRLWIKSVRNGDREANAGTDRIFSAVNAKCQYLFQEENWAPSPKMTLGSHCSPKCPCLHLLVTTWPHLNS